MKEKSYNEEDEVNVLHFVRFIMDYWVSILASCFICAILGFGLTFFVATKYDSKVVVAFRSNDSNRSVVSGLSAAVGQLGLGVGGAEQDDRTQALEFLQSKRFIVSFIKDNSIKPEIFNGSWNIKSESWNGDTPTDNKAYAFFTKNILKINDDIGRNITEVRFRWKDPVEGAKWANNYVNAANNQLRREAIDEAQRAVIFLNERLAASNITEVRQTIAQLLQHNIETAMLANVHEDYAFKVIDPAIPSDFTAPAFPNRILFTAVGFILGAVIMFLALLMRRLIEAARSARQQGIL